MATIFVGLDVHKRTVCIALATEGAAEPQVLGTFPHDVPSLVKRLKGLVRSPSDRLSCCYEAGPTGYGLCRALRAAGVECMVVAPSLIPRVPGDRVKTDRRDAKKLAGFLRAGQLTAVAVPDEASEAIRDLSRLRTSAKKEERRTKARLGHFMLRHGRIYGQDETRKGRTPSTWTKAHRAWLRTQKFERPAEQFVADNLLKHVEDIEAWVATIDEKLAELTPAWGLWPLVQALQAFRGIKLLTAVILVAELVDLKRFATAPELMAFVGLVPSEQSSGDRTRRGRLTKAGNGNARTALVEAAHAYAFKPGVSTALRKRSVGVAPEVTRIAWKAQGRLHKKLVKMLSRGVLKQIAIAAVARELVGFIWAVGQLDQWVVETEPASAAAG